MSVEGGKPCLDIYAIDVSAGWKGFKRGVN